MMSFLWRWLSPLVFFQVYLAITVILFYFGPWPWPWKAGNEVIIFFYLVAAQLAIAIGYLLAWALLPLGLVGSDSNGGGITSAERFLKIALIVNYAIMIPTSLSRTGGWFPDVLAGLGNPGVAYNENYQRLLDGNPFVLVEYVRMLLSPLIVGVFPVLVVFWNRLPRLIRYQAVLIVVFHLAIFVATGTNKGLADFVIVFPWLLYLAKSAGLSSFRFSWKYLFLFVVLFLAFLLFFGSGQAQRKGGEGTLGVFNTGNGLIYADKDHPVSALLPERGQLVFESISRYVGQGYYALSLAFDVDHQWTFGFGSSMFLARNADALFGTDRFTAHSVPGQLEATTGWGMYSLWHSIYPWMASDVGFFGALLVMGGLSFLFGVCWGRALVCPEPTTIIIVYLLFIMFYYIPANNQVFQMGETFFAFFLCLCMFVCAPKGLTLKSYKMV